MHTAADGDTVAFPLNVISDGKQVNMTTGLVNTTVDSTVYSDGQLAVYEIGQVLLSEGVLGGQAPAPAPLPPKPKKDSPPTSQAPSRSTTVSVDSSGATVRQSVQQLWYPLEWPFLRRCPYAYELSGDR